MKHRVGLGSLKERLNKSTIYYNEFVFRQPMHTWTRSISQDALPPSRHKVRVLFTPHPEWRVLINDGGAPWDSPV